MQKWKNGDEVRRTLGRRKMIVFKKVVTAADVALPSEYECRWRNGDGSFGTANIREDELVSFDPPPRSRAAGISSRRRPFRRRRPPFRALRQGDTI